MQFWIIQGLNSLSLGGLLFLLSSGFSLIFGLMRLANRNKAQPAPRRSKSASKGDKSASRSKAKSKRKREAS